MKSLSKADERKLLAAIEKTATYVNQGLSPNEAIIKAADEDQVRPGHICLMVHAYNTGRTTRQREDGQSVLEKAADFELADASQVLEALYPTQVKTAAAQARAQVVSPEYDVSPAGLVQRRFERRKQALCAKIDLRPIMPLPPRPPRDPQELVKQANFRVERNTRRLERARAEVSAAFDKVASRFRDFLEYFNQSGSESFGDVRKRAALLHGDAGSQLMELVVEHVPRLAKQAARGSLRPARGSPYSEIQDVLDHMVRHGQLKADFQKLSAELQADNEEALGPFVQAPPRSILDGLSWAKSAAGPNDPNPDKKPNQPGLASRALGGVVGGVADGFSGVSGRGGDRFCVIGVQPPTRGQPDCKPLAGRARMTILGISRAL